MSGVGGRQAASSAPIHATRRINVDSYRRRTALARKQKGAGRPRSHATIKDLSAVSLAPHCLA